MAKFLVIFLVLSFLFFPTMIYAEESHLWDITSIDTMKYSRDAAADPKSLLLIPEQVKLVAESGAEYIALDTPYDDRFLPVLTTWVKEARANNLKVWFRGNFSGWEGWFGIPKFSDYHIHHKLTYKFITNNPDLFKQDDIFTSAPEPENGIIGDPRQTGKGKEFNQFLIDSYNNCVKAFNQINISVKCGYFSTNLDVARQILTPDTVSKTGGVVVIDHYTKNPDSQEADILNLYKQFNFPIILGEFGAPIPDLNGSLSEAKQADFIDGLLQIYYKHNKIIKGINYWTLAGGSTAILNNNFEPKLGYQTIKKYFSPIKVEGTIKNTLGEKLTIGQINIAPGELKINPDNNGNFQTILPQGKYTLTFNDSFYKSVSFQIDKKDNINIVTEPKNKDFIYNLRLFFKKLVDSFHKQIV